MFGGHATGCLLSFRMYTPFGSMRSFMAFWAFRPLVLMGEFKWLYLAASSILLLGLLSVLKNLPRSFKGLHLAGNMQFVPSWVCQLINLPIFLLPNNAWWWSDFCPVNFISCTGLCHYTPCLCMSQGYTLSILKSSFSLFLPCCNSHHLSLWKKNKQTRELYNWSFLFLFCL